MATNTKENGLEELIVDYLHDQNDYEVGTNEDYSVPFAVDETRLFWFLETTQPQKLKELHICDSELTKKKFLQYLDKRLRSEGIIHILRKGMKYNHLHLDFFYVRPSEDNPKAGALFRQNIFSVTRQVHYSATNPKLAPDMVIFLNGLPIITFELKNQLTKQNTADAVHQYRGTIRGLVQLQALSGAFCRG